VGRAWRELEAFLWLGQGGVEAGEGERKYRSAGLGLRRAKGDGACV